VVFENDEDRKGFLFRLGKVCECHGWRVAASKDAKHVRIGKTDKNVEMRNLTLYKSKNLRKYEKANGSCCKIYIQSHVRTRSWFKDGEVKVWDDTGDQAYSAPKTRKRTTNLKE